MLSISRHQEIVVESAKVPRKLSPRVSPKAPVDALSKRQPDKRAVGDVSMDVQHQVTGPGLAEAEVDPPWIIAMWKLGIESPPGRVHSRYLNRARYTAKAEVHPLAV